MSAPDAEVVRQVAALLTRAGRVVVVPGHGLAVAQAQHLLRALVDVLADRGTEVAYAVHPVAGRVPGHASLLLDAAGVPQAQRLDPDAADAAFPTTDVVLVVGADDVVNPAARTAPGSAIWGLPVLDVARAGHVVVLKRSLRPGFAGTGNPLLHAPGTTLLLGDARASLTALLAAVAAT